MCRVHLGMSKPEWESLTPSETADLMNYWLMTEKQKNDINSVLGKR